MIHVVSHKCSFASRTESLNLFPNIKCLSLSLSLPVPFAVFPRSSFQSQDSLFLKAAEPEGDPRVSRGRPWGTALPSTSEGQGRPGYAAALVLVPPNLPSSDGRLASLCFGPRGLPLGPLPLCAVTLNELRETGCPPLPQSSRTSLLLVTLRLETLGILLRSRRGQVRGEPALQVPVWTRCCMNEGAAGDTSGSLGPRMTKETERQGAEATAPPRKPRQGSL